MKANPVVRGEKRAKGTKAGAKEINKRLDLEGLQQVPVNLRAHDEELRANEKDSLSVNYLTKGRYVRPDRREDTKFEMYRDLPALGNVDTVIPASEYGDYALKKAALFEHQQRIAFASYLIDPLDPATQRVAYQIVPELQTVPEQEFERRLREQLLLRHMLMTGTVSSQEELDFLFVMCDPEYELPQDSLWDPHGEIANSAEAAKRGRLWIFRPAEFTPPAKANADDTKKAKALILKRVLPGLRLADMSKVVKVVDDVGKRSPIMTGDTRGEFEPWKKFADIMKFVR